MRQEEKSRKKEYKGEGKETSSSHGSIFIFLVLLYPPTIWVQSQMGSKWSRSKGGNKSSKRSQTKDSGDSSPSCGELVVDDSPLRPLCDP